MRTTESNIFKSVTQGDQAALQAYLDADRDLTICDAESYSLLLCAANAGHLSLVRMLLQAGLNVDHTTVEGKSALMIAAQHGYAEIVLELLNAGAAVDQADKGDMTALMFAASHGHRAVVEALLRADADVNQTSDNELTALMYSVKQGDPVIMSSLLEAGADVNHMTEYCCSALILAVMKKSREIVDALLNAGALVSQLLDLVIAPDGMTALGYAVLFGCAEILVSLLNAGLSANTLTNGSTLLMTAAMNGHVDNANVLISAGADVNATRQNDRVTALMIAAENGHTDFVGLLLDAGADVNCIEISGFCALMLAVVRGQTEVVTHLLKNGANLYIEHIFGSTVWSSSEDEMRDFLLSRGGVDPYAEHFISPVIPATLDLIQGMNYLVGVCHYCIQHAFSEEMNLDSNLLKAVFEKTQQIFDRVMRFDTEASPDLYEDSNFLIRIYPSILELTRSPEMLALEPSRYNFIWEALLSTEAAIRGLMEALLGECQMVLRWHPVLRVVLLQTLKDAVAFFSGSLDSRDQRREWLNDVRSDSVLSLLKQSLRQSLMSDFRIMQPALKSLFKLFQVVRFDVRKCFQSMSLEMISAMAMIEQLKACDSDQSRAASLQQLSSERQRLLVYNLYQNYLKNPPTLLLSENHPALQDNSSDWQTSSPGPSMG